MHEREILLAALEKDRPEERETYLAQSCRDNEELRSRVEALLRAAEVQDSFLEHPAVETEVLNRETDAIRQKSAEHEALSLDFLKPVDDASALGGLGQYTITDVIGRGGMGVVLKARDAKLNRVVAIKVMAPELASNPTARKRFVREAQAAAAVVHQHVVTIHAVDEDRLPYLVMEYIDGQSLQEKIDREGHLKLVEILRIGHQIAAGLAAAHAQGLVHRDVKPANILLENGVERVRITDFGLARAIDDVSMTRTGDVAGTPQYMSPEQAQGLALDARSDLFSLGCVLYAMCTGRPPFRAETTLAALRRVCEDVPRPIRDVNPAVPQWLVEIIDRQLAKQPAQRIQTAQEAAELLGQCLAHVQHPSVVGQGPNLPIINSVGKRNVRDRVAYRRLRPWVIAAGAMLVLVLGGLSLSEATGVTGLAATVIRILTPEGTLIVETDDPGVKVTIEGNGGLVINGAGPQEVRLKPGSYRLRADKDGKPLHPDRELVSITRGDKQVVRVLLEGQSSLPAVPPTAESGAFVLLGGKGVAERKFETLSEAAEFARDGDTIEIRGDGPFISDGVNIQQSLVIRAGNGCAPSITLSKAAADRNTPLLNVSAPLVLEGLDLRRIGGAPRSVQGRYPKLIEAWHPTLLHIANSRLSFNSDPGLRIDGNIIGTKAAVFTVRNCELNGNVGYSFQWHYAAGGRCTFENCVNASGALGFHHHDPNNLEVSIRVHRNTIVGDGMAVELWIKPNLHEELDAAQPVRLDFSRNVMRLWDASRKRGVLYFHQYQLEEPLSTEEAESLLPRLVRLDEKQNVYRTGLPLLVVAADWRPLGGKRGRDLADWDRFWTQQNTDSLEGDIRFQGGDLITRALSAPERFTAEDFRLRPDSAGYRAGPDGKDLGADVDLVGPGLAYERWKMTPEYQEWLKDTGQMIRGGRNQESAKN